MLIVQAGDEKVGPWIAATRQRCKALGIQHLSYDLGGLGFGTPMLVDHGDLRRSPFIPCLFKIQVIKDALRKFKNVFYLDADVAVMAPVVWPLDQVVICSKRPKGEIASDGHKAEVGIVNTGILGFSQASWSFLRAWETRARACGIEQKAFNSLVQKAPWCHRVYWVPQEKFHAYGKSDEAVLIHFKGGHGDKVLEAYE